MIEDTSIHMCINDTGDDLDEDVREEEAELRTYLLHGESLSEDTMDKYTAQFWDTEPYKSVSTHTNICQCTCRQGKYIQSVIKT